MSRFNQPLSKTLRRAFWEKVDVTNPDGCWEWLGAKSNGYGYLGIWSERKVTTAHRVSWLLHRGPIPEGKYVCHRCDNKPCVRPDHLFLGTRRDNIVDAGMKGAQIGNPVKLDRREVIIVRAMHRSGMSQRRIAAIFGTSRSPIRNVINDKECYNEGHD